MIEKARRIMDKVCDILELLVALAVVLGLVYYGGCSLLSHMGLIAPIEGSANFMILLEDVFSFVVGIEFTKLLLKPSAEHVIEVLVFLIARHLIIRHSDTWGILASVACVILLYGFNYFLHIKHKSTQTAPHDEKPSDLK